MQIRRAIITAGVLLVASTQSHAQSTIFDACKTLVDNGLKEYNIENSSDSNLTTIFDRYCDDSGSVKTQNLGIGIDVVIKQIPIKLTGSYSSASQAFDNFCKSYASTALSSSARNTYQETIVRRAYDSCDSCIAIATTGVVARHKIEDVERTNFFLAPGFSHPVTVHGISASNGITCKGQDPDAAKGAEIVIDGSFKKTLTNNQTLGFVCTRQAKPDSNGNKVYEEGSVTIFTDISPNGNYTFFMPKNTVLAEADATVIKEQIKKGITELSDKITSADTALRKDINDEFNKFGSHTTAEKQLITMQVDHDPHFPGASGPKSGSKAENKCASNEFISATAFYEEDGYLKTAVWCKEMPKPKLPSAAAATAAK